MRILIKNIKQLLQIREPHTRVLRGKEMAKLPLIENAFVWIEDDTIVSFGEMNELGPLQADKEIDASGKIVLPTWCDSHTHLVYAGNRVGEFVDRINGLSYEEIAQKGGGILNSAKLLQNTSEADLFKQSKERLEEVIKMGTGAIEIKSGYGLNIASELKMLRVIKKLKKKYPIKVKATLLAAHAYPLEYINNKPAYITYIAEELIPTIAKEKLAEFIDVFCEKGYFSIADTNQILSSATQYGLIPKIHVNQFNAFGGIKEAVNHKALSVDHLEVLNPEDLESLKNTSTIPTALPLCSYFLSIPYTPARQIIDAGLPLALATDFNPGSSPSGNMNQVVAAACIKMKMTPEEAINAATLNGAYAMNISKNYGSISKGKKANLLITKKIPDYNYLTYAFGSSLVDKVILKGKVI